MGKWTLSTTAALREDKLEDVHTNPLDGTQLVFTDQTDGVYRMDTPMQFSGGAFDAAASAVTIWQIDASSVAPIGAPDNLAWSRNGKVYVQEDGNGNEMWQINESGDGLVRIATAFSEPSGIIDASAELGYEPGSVLLSSIMGSGSTGAQLVVLISPTAQLAFPPGDFNRDGTVDAADYVVWRKGLGSTYALDDYNIWTAHFGDVAPGSGSISQLPALPSVPEPATLLLALVAAATCYSKRSAHWR
jgi:hypothetical protein